MSRLGSMRALAGLLGAAALAVSAAVPALANHQWANYRWPGPSPVKVTLVDSVTPGWNGYLDAASGDWDASPVLATVPLAQGADDQGTRRRCPAVSGKVRVCNAAYGFNGWLGLAQIWVYANGTIAQGTTKMNDSYFNTASYNSPDWRRFVVCQEVGHTFGLAHQDENFSNTNLGSCMDYTNDPSGTRGTNGALSNLRPNQHDYDQLALIYGGASGTGAATAAAPSGAGSAAEGPDDPSQFGRPVGPKDSHGRGIVFERDLGAGAKLVTHVLWVHPGLPGAGKAR